MAGRPLPIHVFFSFAAEAGLGSSRLSHAAADSGIAVEAKAGDMAVVPDVPLVLVERGKLAVGGIVPSLMEAIVARVQSWGGDVCV